MMYVYLFGSLILLLTGVLLSRILWLLLDIRDAVKTKHPHGYHVTYIIWKDHDFRNQNVPVQERIATGIYWRTISSVIQLKDDATLSPTQLKLSFLKELQDTEITSIDILSVVSLSKLEFDAEISLYQSRM